MSVAGLKKQFHKATQKVSEKVGGAEGTKLDDDFKEMERKVDVTSRAVMEIMTKTIEYLQPNPASRAKLSMINTMSKIRGQEKGPGYPQAEALLAEAMLKFGRELGDDCNFGPALGEVGEAMRELSEVKDSLDMEVKQNFIDPLQNLHDKDLREIQHHLKKLEGRRLDFDYKKKRQGKIPDEELRQALEKFDESKEIAESSMFNLLEMDIEQVSQLSALVQAQLEYHKQAVQILQQVTVRLEERIRQASSQPRREYQPKPRMSLEFATGDSTQPNGGLSHTGTPKPPGVQMDQPCCRALYDFEPENEGELGFKEGDIITLTNQIDENCRLLVLVLIPATENLTKTNIVAVSQETPHLRMTILQVNNSKNGVLPGTGVFCLATHVLLERAEVTGQMLQTSGMDLCEEAASRMGRRVEWTSGGRGASTYLFNNG
uniref:SH3-domain GRB2-like 2 n=1 Tax=Mus musculus TaxID=10090 RepID=A2ALV3_MOUSE